MPIATTEVIHSPTTASKMDIRRLIDPEPSQPFAEQEPPMKKLKTEAHHHSLPYSNQDAYNTALPGCHPHQETKPPRPIPLQANAQNELRASSTSSYGSIPSLYDQSPPGVRGGHTTEHQNNKHSQQPARPTEESKKPADEIAPTEQYQLSPKDEAAANKTAVPLQRRREDPPIYARCSRRNARNPFLINNSQRSRNNEAALGAHGKNSQLKRKRESPLDVQGKIVREPCIWNTYPYEEMTRVISDFLFREVVARGDVGVGAPLQESHGAVLEIEAKLGRLIDKDTKNRIKLPVLSECVVETNEHVAFKSSMTEVRTAPCQAKNVYPIAHKTDSMKAQHRNFNTYLNKAIVASQAPGREKMNYAHTKEIDTFHNMSPNGFQSLPPSIRSQIDPSNPRTIPKIRLTHDKKTGKEIAKIVKVRVADIDVHSPLTKFDWRISVNVEMRIDGDLKDLIETGASSQRSAPRTKDRISYGHMGVYQIDLTQVEVRCS